MRAAPARRSGTCSRLPAEPDSELVRVGRVGRPHGVDGAFVVEEASEDPQRFEIGAELLVEGEPARVTVSRQVGGRRRAIKLDRPVERGAELACAAMTSPRSPDDAYYVSDLDRAGRPRRARRRRRQVRDVNHGPANDALELDTGLLSRSSRTASARWTSTAGTSFSIPASPSDGYGFASCASTSSRSFRLAFDWTRERRPLAAVLDRELELRIFNYRDSTP